jgi:hypothetical protein
MGAGAEKDDRLMHVLTYAGYGPYLRHLYVVVVAAVVAWVLMARPYLVLLQKRVLQALPQEGSIYKVFVHSVPNQSI